MTRFEHVKFDDKSKQISKVCRDACIVLEGHIEKLPISKERATALTKLQECFMWVNKALCEAQLDKQKDTDVRRPTLSQPTVIRKV